MKEKLLQFISWIRHFIKQKFNRNSDDFPYYLSIAIALILFVVGLNAFVELTDELHDNELEPFDVAITDFVVSYRSDALTSFFQVVTHLGDRIAYVILTIVIAIFFFFRFNSWKFSLQTIAVLILSSLSNIALKRIINRTRPTIEHLVSVNSLSYPSGHAMSAMAFYGFLIYLMLAFDIAGWLRIVIISFLAFMILSIGVSRIYLGVHYPSDVAAGFIGGLIWVTFSAIVFNIVDLLRKRKGDENDHGIKS